MRRCSFILALTVLLAGCGGGGNKSSSAKPQGKADQGAAKAAQQYVDAYVAKDPKAICALLATPVKAQLTAKGTCVKTIKSAMPAAPQKLKTDQSYRTGDNAIVTFRSSPRQVKLVLEAKRWKVVDGGT
jgi:hypothetical protein